MVFVRKIYKGKKDHKHGTVVTRVKGPFDKHKLKLVIMSKTK